MELGEIIKNATLYPLNNLQALIIYLALGLLIGIVAALTGLGSITTGALNFESGVVLGIIGLIVIFVLALLMTGLSLDIVRFGIDRRVDAPGIDFASQIANGLKYVVLVFVYMIIPIIITTVLGVIFRNWLASILGIIITIIFYILLAMAICRLAETGQLSYALNFMGAYNDWAQLGFARVILFLLVAEVVGFVIVFVISFIFGVILSIIGNADITSFVVIILAAVLDAWLFFYSNRVMGLLYSNK